MLLLCLHFRFPVQAGAQQRCSCAPLGPCPESRRCCTPQVASVTPPPGSGMGDVTDTVQMMFLIILAGGRIISLGHHLDFVYCS